MDNLRSAFGDDSGKTSAGHQCQFPGVDVKKPTRLFSDLLGVEGFGYPGWPVLDSNFNYRGPLPPGCGHAHTTKTIGKNEDGAFHISPTSAYLKLMREWLATLIYDNWLQHASRFDPTGGP